MKDRRDIYQEVTDRIVAQLEAGGLAPWSRPWKLSGGFPVNINNGKPYRGINVLLLMMENYDDPRWGTYRAISTAGGQVRKGEKSTRIVLWKRTERKSPKEGEDKSYVFLRDFSVFNANQADGLPELPVEEEREVSVIEAADEIVRGYVWAEGSASAISAHTDVSRINQAIGPMVRHGHDRAAYSPLRDIVEMPDAKQFVSDEAYYSTLFHELVHSTGHENRLKRLEPAWFGSDPYAKEELVAEIGASFLAGIAGLERSDDQSAAYVDGWLGRIKGDSKLIVQAAAQAQKAADLVLGTTFDNQPANAGSDLAAA